MPGKDEAFAAVETAYVDFRNLLVPLEDAAYGELVCGDWDLSHLLAHMAGWYRELTPELAARAEGRPTPFSHWADADSWNARFVERAVPGAAALDDYDEAFHEFYGAARSIPDERWERAADGLPGPLEELFVGLVVDHTAEHRGEIEAWLARR